MAFLKKRLRLALASWVLGIASRRPPDFVVGPAGGPVYLRRWWLLPRNPLCNLYLHEFVSSDDDRALHDHPWASLSLVLSGLYTEVVPANPKQSSGWDYMPNGVTRRLRRPGNLIPRGARMRHRIEVSPSLGPSWTLFLTGPVIREWGFHCRHGWVPWRNFVDECDHGALGAGCEGSTRKPLPFWKVWTGRDA